MLGSGAPPVMEATAIGFARDCKEDLGNAWDSMLTLGKGFLQKKLGPSPASAPASPALVLVPMASGASLDLKSLNPSLFVVGIDIVERLMPRYLTKAGIACERMQHAGMPVSAIRKVLTTCFVVDGAHGGFQLEEGLRDVFGMFDTSGDEFLDEDEFLSLLPLLGEDVPPEVISKLFELVDENESGTIDGSEFVDFVRAANPADESLPDGWRAFLPESAAHEEEMVMLEVRRRPQGRGGGEADGGPARAAWATIAPADLAALQRTVEKSWSTSVIINRVDVANAEAMIRGLRELELRDEEILAVVRALFVSQSDADYAKVFDVFDKDGTGGIDPFEFCTIMALLGDHSTEAEARQLFLDADGDNDGTLDVAEFTSLLKRISPKARSATDMHQARDTIARERLQQRIQQVHVEDADPAQADATVQVLVLGPSRAGKTYLLNQVLSEKLPKGRTVAVGVGALVVRLGPLHVAVQVLDAPGDVRFAPLSLVFYPAVEYALLIFDATSLQSFEDVEALRAGFMAAHPHADPASCMCLVANTARIGVKKAISAGFAIEWCRQHGDIPYFEVDADAPQGILEPVRFLADEYLTEHPPTPRDDGGAADALAAVEARAGLERARRRRADLELMGARMRGSVRGQGSAAAAAPAPAEDSFSRSGSHRHSRRSTHGRGAS